MFLLLRWTEQKKRLAEKHKQFAEQQIKQLEQEKQLIATQAVLDVKTQERSRLARDLHDGLGSMLTGVKLNLESVKNKTVIEQCDAEYFSNSMKHSGASHILVEIVAGSDKLFLTVQDDGCGFDYSEESKGMGLSNIRTRVTAYNGILNVDSKSGVGTEISVELTIDN